MQRKRNASLDLIRSAAIFMVISVHFLLNTGFYDTIIMGKKIYLMCVARTIFMTCVPLFLLLTGYLMNQKELSVQYYKGIRKTIAIYFLASLVCMIYRVYVLGENITFKLGILNILDFTGAPYAWYIEMYIGLFLLIPFLNLVYHNLETKRKKQLLILTFLCLTMLPSLCNIYDFCTKGWWRDPGSSIQYNGIVPEWWVQLYPISYYYIGAYLKEYEIGISKKKNAVCIVIFAFMFGTFSFYRSFHRQYESGIYNDWGGYQVVIMSVLIFLLLLHINLDGWKEIKKGIITKISELSLGMYLTSWIFDRFFYVKLAARVTNVPDRLWFYPLMVALVFLCSFLCSWILNALYNFGERGRCLVQGKFQLLKKKQV